MNRINEKPIFVQCLETIRTDNDNVTELKKIVDSSTGYTLAHIDLDRFQSSEIKDRISKGAIFARVLKATNFDRTGLLISKTAAAKVVGSKISREYIFLSISETGYEVYNLGTFVSNDNGETYGIDSNLKDLGENGTINDLRSLSNIYTDSTIGTDLSEIVAWVKAIKDHVVQNGNTTEVGGALEVDGAASFSSDVTMGSDLEVNGHAEVDGSLGVHGDLVIADVNKIKDENGNDIFASHNSIVRGKDITSYYTDGTLWQRIAGTNGFEPFEDLYLGDYFQMNRNITCPDSYGSTVGSNYVCIAGFNTKYGNGDSALTQFNHIVVVPGKCNLASRDFGTQHFGRHAMNASHTTEGGYAGSAMHHAVYGAGDDNNAVLTIEGSINYQLYQEFGDHLKKTRELLSNAVGTSLYNRFGEASGASSGWAWYDAYAINMSEVEAYGAPIWSSSGFDTGAAKERFPLFALAEGTLNDRSAYYWLKDVASASHFCRVCGNGAANYGNAGNSDFCVRPCFVLA